MKKTVQRVIDTIRENGGEAGDYGSVIVSE